MSTSTVPGRPAQEFRRTDVGIVPQDWDVSTVGTEFSIQLGKMIDAAKNVGVIKPYVGNRAVQWGRIDLDAIATVPMSQSDLQRFRLQRGDLLVCEGGEIGRAAIWDDPIPECYYQKAIHRLRARHGYDTVLMMSLLQLWTSTGRLANYVTQTSIAHLPKDKFELVPLPVPSPEEQHAIAEALSDVDGLLAALEKLIAKKRAIKQAAMQQLLTGKTRLPGFTGKWRERPLADLAVVTMGQSPESKFYNGRGDGLPLIQGNADIENRQTIDRVWTTQASKRCDAGDLLLTVRAPVGAVGIAAKVACLGRGVCGLKPLGDAAFLFHALVYAEPRWKVFEQGSTFTSANSKQVRQFLLSAPEEQDEQAAIATVLSDMDAEIEALECRRDKTKQIKQGMMQQLLTGRIRLVKPEAQGPATQIEADTKASKPHSWAFNEAVVIATLAQNFGSEQFPLGRKRYTKLSYLLHRHAEKQAEGYLKKAAGPYNPRTKYGGPEKIAQRNAYIREHKRGPYRGFVAADSIAQAEGYFEKWYGPDSIQWLEQFRFMKNDELEVLATVDMVAEELRAAGKNIDMAGVKDVIRSHPQWKAKLDRPVFSDANIAKAIKTSRELFESSGEPAP